MGGKSLEERKKLKEPEAGDVGDRTRRNREMMQCLCLWLLDFGLMIMITGMIWNLSVVR